MGQSLKKEHKIIYAMNPLLNSLLLSSALLLGAACSSNNQQENLTMNPFFNTFDTPYGIPNFESIKEEHYVSAMREGMRIQKEEIDEITRNSAAPSFENTIVALENSGELLNQVLSVFYNLNSAHTNETMQQIAQEMAPELSAHSDDIALNAVLFDRVKKVYEQRTTLNLDTEDLRLLDKKYKGFARGGALLSDKDKDVLREINSELSVLSLQFQENVMKETNDFEFVVSKESDLAGLPTDLISSAAELAKEKGKTGSWVFNLSNPMILPFLQYAENRMLREQIWQEYQTRGSKGNANDNNQIITKMVNLRQKKAALLGYDSHAHFVLEESMAGSPDEVMNLLNQLWTPAINSANVELNDLQNMVNAEGKNFQIAPWDWRYYTERIRKEKYNIDEQEVKQYFPAMAVQEGIFLLCKKLYGLTFNEIIDAPKYHEDVQTFEVREADGTVTGVLMIDLHVRPSKSGGAWMTSYREQKKVKGKRVIPIISIVCNFPKPLDGPSLLNFDEVETFFHEFGHALHGLLSDVRYQSLAGTNVPTDFVELPSQIMEHWASEPEFMRMYAKHYKTGVVIPDALIEKLLNLGTFDQGFATTEYLAAALLDMEFHMLTEPMREDVHTVELRAMKRLGLIDAIIPRYRSSYFGHIFAGGYSAGYYSYIWSGVLDNDGFQAFKETSLFDRATADKFRTFVLEKGGTAEPMELYESFRGRKPIVEPLLVKRGLK
jgi:peptidyl-dipeptidase Dcp